MARRTKREPLHLGTVTGYVVAQKVRDALFTLMDVDARILPLASSDSTLADATFWYAVMTDQRLTQVQHLIAQATVRAAAYGFTGQVL